MFFFSFETCFYSLQFAVHMCDRIALIYLKNLQKSLSLFETSSQIPHV